jgi:hypothetical protein
MMTDWAHHRAAARAALSYVLRRQVPNASDSFATAQPGRVQGASLLQWKTPICDVHARQCSSAQSWFIMPLKLASLVNKHHRRQGLEGLGGASHLVGDAAAAAAQHFKHPVAPIQLVARLEVAAPSGTFIQTMVMR